MTELTFTKVLIANRGEIAVRIARACRELGLGSVAVYSLADKNARHVRSADQAYCVGPAPAAESYLKMDALLSAARAGAADAVHPGYGLLAENAAFARAVREAGMVWVGPPPDVIAVMGDKVAAKKLALSVGVPVVPGYAGEDQSLERMLHEAGQIGFPVMLKAAAGGGGRGMRVVFGADALPDALNSAKREARSAFRDDRIFLEMLLNRPRHIEIQVLADAHGNILHLGERDCSVQRRHQKVVEEAPSPVITPELRARMGRDAVRLARAGGYVNAGTIEFLFSADSYYFLEMNTRIQVEHAVTEVVTGLDLVRLQLEIASGRPLDMSQLDLKLQGHAVEARIYAEDPYYGFVPATGRVEAFQPPEGPGIRNDVGVSEGDEITTHYDSMLAKLIAAGPTRSAALARLKEALAQYTILGTTTNLPFLRWLMQQTEFTSGRADTGFLEAAWSYTAPMHPPRDVLLSAAAFELIRAWPGPLEGGKVGDSYSPWHSLGAWRMGGSRSLYFRHGDRRWRVDVALNVDGHWDMTAAGETTRVHIERLGTRTITLLEEGRVVHSTVSRSSDGLSIAVNGETYSLQRDAPSDAHGSGSSASTSERLAAPMPGTVVRVAVQEGERVGVNQPLVVLEAMKMEHVIQAPHDAIVRAVLCRVGDLVPAGAPVVQLEGV